MAAMASIGCGSRRSALTRLTIVWMVVFGVSAAAAPPVETTVREEERLAAVKAVAVLPPVILLRFDRDGRLPDPDRLATRVLVAEALSATLPVQLAQRGYRVTPAEDLQLQTALLHLGPTDLYRTVVRSAFDSPVAKESDRAGDMAELLATREEAGDSPTLFRYRWHDRPDSVTGLAALGPVAEIAPVADRVRRLGEKLGADALLLWQVGEMDVRQGGANTPLGYALGGGAFSSTRIDLSFMLVATNDGAVLWRATARGTESGKLGLSGRRSDHSRDQQQALHGAAQAANHLLDNLIQPGGSGKG